jgi:hypothetical protein
VPRTSSAPNTRRPGLFSSTHVDPNPNPLIEVASGPTGGAILPLIALLIVDFFGVRWSYLLRFFAAVCLIANGAYLAFGWIDAVGDTGELLRLGVPPWMMLASGVPMMAAGLACWHGQGKRFGLGSEGIKTNRHHAAAVVVLTLALLLAERLAGTWSH